MSKQAIINLTQHKATPEQTTAGVVDMAEDWRTRVLVQLLTFDKIPDATELRGAAESIAYLCTEQFPTANTAMIGGAPYLMAPLERALIDRGIKPIYGFSKRESVDEHLPDGSVKKTMVFRHLGFVEV